METLNSSNKRQKTDKQEGNDKQQQINGKEKVNQNLNKCHYINLKKNKQCGLQVRKGQKYCFAHINIANSLDDADNSKNVSQIEAEITRTSKKGEIIRRVKCSIDPSHTVWEDKLTKHLKICNVVKHKAEIEAKEKNCAWFNIDYNVKDVEDKIVENEINYDDWKKLINSWVNKYDAKFISELPLKEIEYIEGLEERFAELSNQKHIRQQSSLIGQLFEHGIIEKDVDPGVIIEFGCGRAEFSRYFNKAIDHMNVNKDEIKGNKYLLIDRDNPRLKFDNKIISDSEEKGIKNVEVNRLKVDIKDLKLHEALKQFKNSEQIKYIGISKHLCGVATDLTLRCLINAKTDCDQDDMSNMKFGGCLVAMCCRHCCKYECLLSESKKFLDEEFGINNSNFIYFRKMFAWATNGIMPGHLKSDIGDHFTGFSYQEREVIGLKMRRILDESRKYAMQKFGFDVSIVKYVKRDISLENNCIIIKNVV